MSRPRPQAAKFLPPHDERARHTESHLGKLPVNVLKFVLAKYGAYLASYAGVQRRSGRRIRRNDASALGI